MIFGDSDSHIRGRSAAARIGAAREEATMGRMMRDTMKALKQGRRREAAPLAKTVTANPKQPEKPAEPAPAVDERARPDRKKRIVACAPVQAFWTTRHPPRRDRYRRRREIPNTVSRAALANRPRTRESVSMAQTLFDKIRHVPPVVTREDDTTLLWMDADRSDRPWAQPDR
jgi:hypothetical protein